MTLLFDTTNPEAVWFALIDKGELVSESSWTTNRDLSERLVPEMNAFLKKRKMNIKDLDKLAVVRGPGHFSCLRTGVATANALAYGLRIPVTGVDAHEKTDFKRIDAAKGQKTILPFYGKEPNISKPKKPKLSKIK